MMIETNNSTAIPSTMANARMLSLIDPQIPSSGRSSTPQMVFIESFSSIKTPVAPTSNMIAPSTDDVTPE